jgi:hypothetical protein
MRISFRLSVAAALGKILSSPRFSRTLVLAAPEQLFER